ncbi:MAG TPA: IS630 family transposase [Solirubrobacterales bacterium]|nr:IS630 family transposase [Solirubrobacterales bacterium]
MPRGRRATQITLTEGERAELERIARAGTSEQRLAQRARVVLLAAEGQRTIDIARQVGLSPQKAAQWRGRFHRERLGGLRDRPRAGGPRRYDHDARLAVFRTACAEPPEGETRWTVRGLAEAVGIGKSQVHAILEAADLKPHQVRSWLTSLDPDFDTKQAEVCGLYLRPPKGAIVVSIDEKTGVQAKEPVRPTLPMEPGIPERREFEYRRHGTVALLAALLVHTGTITGAVYERNTRVEFVDFLGRLDAQIPAGKKVHAILDNLQVHKTPEVADWLAEHSRWSFHFTPTHASWLNQIELWFSILSRRLLKRGIFTSREDLTAQLMAFIERYNPTAKPFAWTYAGKPLTK